MKVVEAFENQVSMPKRSTSHTHKSSKNAAHPQRFESFQERRPFRKEDGRSFELFPEISQNQTHLLDKVKFSEWIDRQKKTSCCITLFQMEAE